MSFEEGKALLGGLQEFATQPQYVCRHKWTVGDFLLFDNTGTMHKAAPYDLDSKRLMDRTTLTARNRSLERNRGRDPRGGKVPGRQLPPAHSHHAGRPRAARLTPDKSPFRGRREGVDKR